MVVYKDREDLALSMGSAYFLNCFIDNRGTAGGALILFYLLLLC